MFTDYIAKEITDNREDLRRLLEKDPFVANAAFHYLKATCMTQDKRKPDEFRARWKPRVEDYGLQDFARVFQAPEVPIHQMQRFSFHVSFTFTLGKPYLSRDDAPFYMIDNPVKKDKVFRLPYVSPGTYKGALRSAARYVMGNPPTPDADFDNEQIERLFGTDKRREQDELQAGRLRFFPTFLPQTGLEIINPHNREKGAGSLPIQFETAHGEGRFNLLYFPFDSDTTNPSYSEVAGDIVGVVHALQAMLTVYGFGAKTSSGFGTVSSIKDGRLRMHFEDVPESKSVSNESLPGYLAAPGRLKPEYLTPDDAFRERLADELSKVNKKTRQDYDKAKKWWERKQREQTEAAPPPASRPISERSFATFQGLIDVAGELAGRLKAQGGAGE